MEFWGRWGWGWGVGSGGGGWGGGGAQAKDKEEKRLAVEERVYSLSVPYVAHQVLPYHSKAYHTLGEYLATTHPVLANPNPS